MSLSPEEAALFGEDPVTVAPVAEKADDFGWDDEPAPAKPSLIMPDCKDCGASLNPDNGSQLRSGEWKHIRCPKAPGAVALVPSGPPPADIPAPSATEPVPVSFPATPEPAPATVAAEAPKRRGRPPKNPVSVAPTADEPAPAPPVAREHHEELKRVLDVQGEMLAGKAVLVRVEHELGPETLNLLRQLFGE